MTNKPTVVTVEDNEYGICVLVTRTADLEVAKASVIEYVGDTAIMEPVESGKYYLKTPSQWSFSYRHSEKGVGSASPGFLFKLKPINRESA